MYGSGDGSDQLFTVDLQTGKASVVGKLGFGDVAGIAYDLVDSRLYGVDRVTDQLIEIDPKTGATVAVGPIGFPNLRGLTIGPNGLLLGVEGLGTEDDRLIQIDKATGAGSIVGELNHMPVPAVNGLAYDSISMALFGVDPRNDRLLQIDAQTGKATDVGPLGFEVVTGLAVVNATSVPEPSTAFAYVGLLLAFCSDRRWVRPNPETHQG